MLMDLVSSIFCYNQINNIMFGGASKEGVRCKMEVEID